MKQRNTANRRSPPEADDSALKPVPELPAWKAFVVQFSRDAGMQSSPFSGRVEHLSSGRRARFSSAAELLKVLDKMLAELGTAQGVDGLRG